MHFVNPAVRLILNKRVFHTECYRPTLLKIYIYVNVIAQKPMGAYRNHYSDLTGKYKTCLVDRFFFNLTKLSLN